MNRILTALLIVVVAGCLAAGGVWYSKHRGESQANFRTSTVTRGDLLVTISATGTVEPEETVDVGAQVTGRIIDFGKDKKGNTIDYGSQVEQGKVLAHIDPTLFQADLASVQAQLEANRAAVDRAVADLGQLRAKLTQAQRDWE